MNPVFFPEPWLQAIAWGLIAALWKGSLLAVLLAILLRVFHRASAQALYLLSLMALLGSLGWVVHGVVQHAAALQAASMQPSEAALAFRQSLASLPTSSASGAWQAGWWQEAEVRLTSYLPWLFYAWLIGLGGLSLRLLGGLAYVWNLRRTATPLLEAHWRDRTHSLARQMGLLWPVEVRTSHKVGEPLAIGYLKPLILLPAGLLTGLAPEQVEALLIHELAHLRRADYWVNLLQTLVEALLFFHPAIWWMSGQVRALREHCCDDWVLRMTHSPNTYAQALLTVHSFHVYPQTSFTMNATGTKGLLTHRIQRLFSPNTHRPQALLRSFWAMALLCTGILCLAFRPHTSPAVAPVPKAPAPEVASMPAQPIPPAAPPQPNATSQLSPAQARVDSPIVRLRPSEPIAPAQSMQNPLIFIDGVRKGRATMNEAVKNLQLSDIARIDVLKGTAAVERFGEEGEQGVVEIWTKGAEAPELAQEAVAPEKVIAPSPPVLHFEQTDEGAQDEGARKAIRMRAPKGRPEPLFIIDGKRVDLGEHGLPIAPSDIKSINVRRDENATKVYGTDAMHGAIEITTHAGFTTPEESHPSQTPAADEQVNVKGTRIRLSPAATLQADTLEVELKEQALARPLATETTETAATSWRDMDVSVFPNPVGEALTVELTSQAATSLEVFVLNDQGQQVAALWKGSMKAGEQKRLRWDVQQQAAGTYHVFVLKGDQAMSKAVQVH